jgi:hypothetical protein
VRIRGKRGSNETVRLRDANSPSNPINKPNTPVTMTPDDDVLFDMSPNDANNNKPGTTPEPVIPGKPATTGVPLPDPVPANPPSPATTAPRPKPLPTTPTPTTTTPQPASSPYHTVVKGDTLYNISKRYNTTVAKLKQLNNLRSDYIQIGQTLRVQ